MAVSVLTAAVGFRELAAKLAAADTKIVVPEVRKAQRNIANLAARQLRARSPFPHIKKTIRPKTGSRGLFAAVTFDPVTQRGRGKGAEFRVAWAYDNSPPGSKWRRGGHHSYRWIKGLPPELQGPAATEIAAAGRAIEAALASKGAG